MSQEEEKGKKNRRYLYDQASQRVNLGDFDEWNEAMEKSPENRKYYYEHLSQVFNVGSYEEFESAYGQVSLSSSETEESPVKKKDNQYRNFFDKYSPESNKESVLTSAKSAGKKALEENKKKSSDEAQANATKVEDNMPSSKEDVGTRFWDSFTLEGIGTRLEKREKQNEEINKRAYQNALDKVYKSKPLDPDKSELENLEDFANEVKKETGEGEGWSKYWNSKIKYFQGVEPTRDDYITASQSRSESGMPLRRKRDAEKVELLKAEKNATAVTIRHDALAQRRDAFEKVPELKAKVDAVNDQIKLINKIAEEEPNQDTEIILWDAIRELEVMSNDKDMKELMYIEDELKSLGATYEVIFQNPAVIKAKAEERERKEAQDFADKMYEKMPWPAKLYVSTSSPVLRVATSTIESFATLPRNIKQATSSSPSYGGFDFIAENTENLIESVDNFIAPQPSKFENKGLFGKKEDGEWGINYDVLWPKLVRTGAEMAGLLYGGRAGSSLLLKTAQAGKAGALISNAKKLKDLTDYAGLIGSSYILTHNQYYNHAIQAGLDPSQAGKFALTSAITTSFLEGISPNKLLLGGDGFKRLITKNVAKQIAKGIGNGRAWVNGFKLVGKEISFEELQEMTQLLADKSIEYTTNEVIGRSAFKAFDDANLMNEVFETALLTALVTLAPASVRAYSESHPDKLYKSALKQFIADKQNLIPKLNEAFEKYNVSAENRRKILSDILVAEMGTKIKDISEEQMSGTENPKYTYAGKEITREEAEKVIAEAKSFIDLAPLSITGDPIAKVILNERVDQFIPELEEARRQEINNELGKLEEQKLETEENTPEREEIQLKIDELNDELMGLEDSQEKKEAESLLNINLGEEVVLDDNELETINESVYGQSNLPKELTDKLTDTQKSVVERAKKSLMAVNTLSNSLGGKNVKVRFAQSNEEVAKLAKEAGREVQEGEVADGFINRSGEQAEIVVNINAEDTSTIFHESSHPITDVIKATNRELYDKVVKEASEWDTGVIGDNGKSMTLAEYVKDGIKEDISEDELNDEILTEYFAQASEKKFENASPIGQALRQLIEELLRLFNVDTSVKLDLSNDATLKDISGKVSKALAEGKRLKVKGKDGKTKGRIPMEVTEGVSFKKGSEVAPSIADETLSKLEIDDGNVVLYHFSGKDLGGFVKPDYFGQNLHTSERNTQSNKTAFFYVKPSDVEYRFAGLPFYTAKVPLNDLYDFNNDPNNYYDQALKQFKEDFGSVAFTPQRQLNYISDIAKENGFKGMIVTWNGTKRVDMFEAVPVDQGTSESNSTVSYKRKKRKINSLGEVTNKAEAQEYIKQEQEIFPEAMPLELEYKKGKKGKMGWNPKSHSYLLQRGAIQYWSEKEKSMTPEGLKALKNEVLKEGKKALKNAGVKSAIGWYSKMRDWFELNFGSNTEFASQILATLSPQTDPDQNFKYFEQAIRRYSLGEFDGLLERFHIHITKVMSMSEAELRKKWDEKGVKGKFIGVDEYRAQLINEYSNLSNKKTYVEEPLQNVWDEDKKRYKKFGINGSGLLKALYGIWLDQISSPKTFYFAGNLSGRTYNSTIDLWMARFMRRVIYSGKQEQWRILPSQEKPVAGKLLKDRRPEGDYKFAQSIIDSVAEEMGMSPDDFQALLWFHEKEVWDKNGWSEVYTKKGNFDEVAFSYDLERYNIGLTTFKKGAPFNKKEFTKQLNLLKQEIRKLGGGLWVLRATESQGEYKGDTEPSFDIEFTVESGTDISKVWDLAVKISKKFNQESVLLTKIQEEGGNGKIIEIGVNQTKSSEELEGVIEQLKQFLRDKGITGFSVNRDTRGKPLGIDTVFYSEWAGENFTKETFDQIHKELQNEFGKDENISFIYNNNAQIKVHENGKGQVQTQDTGVNTDTRAEAKASGTKTKDAGRSKGIGESKRRGEEGVRKGSQEDGGVAFSRKPMSKVVELAKQQKGFKSWFGNSKVVDPNGEPLIVYHGTTAIFDEFQEEKLGSKNALAPSAYKGFFFAESPATSEGYTSDFTNISMRAWFGNEEIAKYFEDAQEKYKPQMDALQARKDEIWAEFEASMEQKRNELREQLKNKGTTLGDETIDSIAKFFVDDLRIKTQDRIEEELGAKIREVNFKTNMEAEMMYNANNGRGANIMPVFLSIQNPLDHEFTDADNRDGESFSRLIDQAKKEGRDGAIFRNVKDGSDVADNIYVVFKPNQIKSATGNSGEFNPNVNNVAFARRNPNREIPRGKGKKFSQTVKKILNIGSQSRQLKTLRDQIIKDPESYEREVLRQGEVSARLALSDMATLYDVFDEHHTLAEASDITTLAGLEIMNRLIAEIENKKTVLKGELTEEERKAVQDKLTEQENELEKVFRTYDKAGTNLGRLLRQYGELTKGSYLGIMRMVDRAVYKAGQKLTPEQRQIMQRLASNYIAESDKMKDSGVEVIKDPENLDLAESFLEAEKKAMDAYVKLARAIHDAVPAQLQEVWKLLIMGNLLVPSSISVNTTSNFTWLPFKGFFNATGSYSQSVADFFKTGKWNNDFWASVYYANSGTKVLTPKWLKRLRKNRTVTVPKHAQAWAKGIKGLWEDPATWTSDISNMGIKSELRTWNTIMTLLGGFKVGDVTIGRKPELWPRAVPKKKKSAKKATKKKAPKKKDNKGRIKTAEYLKKVAHSLSGANAEMMFRLLYATDKPFRYIGEIAEAYRILKGKGVEIKNDAHLRALMLTFSPEEKIQVKNAGNEATFSQPRELAKTAYGFGVFLEKTIDVFFEGKGKKANQFLTMTKALAKVFKTANQPYVTVPMNLAQEVLEVAWLPATLAGMSKALLDGNAKAFGKYAGKMILGATLRSLAGGLYAMGLISGATGDDDDAEKSFKYQARPPLSINTSGLTRYIHGLDPTPQLYDDWHNVSRLGQLGMYLTWYATYREMLEEQGEEEMPFWIDGDGLTALFHTTMEQSFMQTSSALYEGLFDDPDKGITYFGELGTVVTSAILPNNWTALGVRPTRKYILSPRDANTWNQILKQQALRIYDNKEDAEAWLKPIGDLIGEEIKVFPITDYFGDPVLAHPNPEINPYWEQITPMKKVTVTNPVAFYMSELIRKTKPELRGDILPSMPKNISIKGESDVFKYSDGTEGKTLSLQIDPVDYQLIYMASGKERSFTIRNKMSDSKFMKKPPIEQMLELKAEIGRINSGYIKLLGERISKGIDKGEILLDIDSKGNGTYKYNYPRYDTDWLMKLIKDMQVGRTIRKSEKDEMLNKIQEQTPLFK